MNKSENLTSRNSSIELLRIFAMCGVVMLHYNNETAGGGFLFANNVNRIVLILLESVCICAVNLYVLLSGYYLSATMKRRCIKPLELLVQVSIFNAALQNLGSFLAGTLSVKGILLSIIPQNYFVILYTAVYLVSPYVNLAMSRLKDAALHKLVLLLLVMFSLWNTMIDQFQLLLNVDLSVMSTIGAKGSQMGYTVVNFLLMYVLGAYIRRNEAQLMKLAVWKYLGMFAICGVVLTVWALVYPDVAWSYCNPVVIAMACLLMLAFLKWQFSSKWVNRLAKASFTCFLLHGVFLTRIGIDVAVQKSLPVMLVHIVLSIAAIYVVCYVVHLVWSWVTTPVFRWIGGKLKGADQWLQIDMQQN